MRYANISDAKKNGVVYTPRKMANYLANEIYKHWKGKKTDSIDILDPAVGKGELLISMIQLLIEKGIKKIHAVGYEMNKSIAITTQKQLNALFPSLKIEIRAEDFLEAIKLNIVDKNSFHN